VYELVAPAPSYRDSFLAAVAEAVAAMPLHMGLDPEHPTFTVDGTDVSTAIRDPHIATVVSKVKSGAEAANRFLSAPGEAVKGLFRTAGADAARATAANTVRTVARATVQEISKKTANETLRYGIDVAVDMSTRGRTDKTPWNSFTIPKFYNLVTTGDTKPRTASAASSTASSNAPITARRLRTRMRSIPMYGRQWVKKISSLSVSLSLSRTKSTAQCLSRRVT